MKLDRANSVSEDGATIASPPGLDHKTRSTISTFFRQVASFVGLRAASSPDVVYTSAVENKRVALGKRVETKICVIGLRGIPHVTGGIETHCENVYERLAGLRPNMKFVVFGRKPYIGQERFDTPAGVRVVPSAAMKNKYLETFSNTFLSLIQARFVEKTDLVHIHAIGPGLFAPMARLLGMKVVLTHHGDDFMRAKWNRFAKSVLKTGERFGMLSANEVIAVSPALTERLRTDYPTCSESLSYIPNGADHILTEQAPENPQEILDRYGLKPGEYVISVGRLVPEKGFMDLIQAHRISGIKLPLVLVGGHSNSSHDQELFDAAHDGVIFTGGVDRSEVAVLVENARLFVLPSYHEGLPIVALEASVLGTPVLLSDIPANKDVGLDDMRYFPVGDVEELASRLKSDALHMKPIDLSKDFRWDNIALKTSAVYDQLLNS